jgi:hypothetical protein
VRNLSSSNKHIREVCLPIVTAELYNESDELLPAEDFQRIMLETLDETMSSLGKKAKQSVYSQLEKTFRITKQDIPIEIETFTIAFEEVIGPGAELLEIEIMRHLYEKIGSKFKYFPKQKNLTFTEYLTAARIFLSKHTSARKPMPDEYYEYKFC